MTITTPAPQEPVLHVPVRRSGGTYTLRLFRQRDGGRCAVAFTRPEGLTALLGPGQASARLSEPALRALAEPLGVTALVIDPQLIAAPVTAPAASPAPRALSTTP
ncbi:SAV_915 family protein [Kitasatospora sp. NPDC051853]|uniref:SAV_915 family protein n=1 Tax=Kitasatospora sp. NPDC051853 TaxID=3364058 RepID=UPI00379B5F36